MCLSSIQSYTSVGVVWCCSIFTPWNRNLGLSSARANKTVKNLTRAYVFVREVCLLSSVRVTRNECLWKCYKRNQHVTLPELSRTIALRQTNSSGLSLSMRKREAVASSMSKISAMPSTQSPSLLENRVRENMRSFVWILEFNVLFFFTTLIPKKQECWVNEHRMQILQINCDLELI